MATALQLLNEQYNLMYVVMPTYIYKRDWDKVKLYFQARLQEIQRQIDEYEKKVDEVEERTTALKARVVELENA